MNPAIAMNLLTNEVSIDHRINQPLRHQRRAPQIARELVLQTGTPDYRAKHRGTAGTAQQRGPSRELDALGIEVLADGFVVGDPLSAAGLRNPAPRTRWFG
jgi:hypothetical protein